MCICLAKWMKILFSGFFRTPISCNPPYRLHNTLCHTLTTDTFIISSTLSLSLSLCRLQHLAMPSRLTVVLVSLLLATPAVALWLWLVILSAIVAIQCPEGCRCDPTGYNVECKSVSLTAVPLIRLTDVRALDLSFNEMTLLEKNSFVSMPELEILVPDVCGLRHIELGASNGLTELRQLKIGFNRISEIIPGTFQCMSILEHLDLCCNRLEHLDIGVFSGLVNLNFISLSNNMLQYLHPDTFLGSPKLQTFDLDQNSVLQVPTDRNFINSKSLSFLSIQRCGISSVSVETFANVSALKWLSLNNNILRTLDINILRALPTLSELYM